MATVDNSADKDLDALITWQFDNAEHLCGIVDMLKEFFSKAVTEPWDNVYDRTLGEGGDDKSEWYVNRIGEILGIPRYQIHANPDSDEFTPIGISTYVKLISATNILRASNGGLASYWRFYHTIFGDGVKFVDNHNMTCSLLGTQSELARTPELLSLFLLYGKQLVELPTGVMWDGDLSYHLFSCAKSNDERQDGRITNFDPAKSGSFYWE